MREGSGSETGAASDDQVLGRRGVVAITLASANFVVYLIFAKVSLDEENRSD